MKLEWRKDRIWREGRVEVGGREIAESDVESELEGRYHESGCSVGHRILVVDE